MSLGVTGQALGSQSTTTNPQTLSSSSGSSSPTTSGVQPGTAAGLLTSNSGQSLQNPPLSAINLANASQGQSSSTQALPSQPSSHHFNTAYLAIPVVLVVLAVVLFWIANRSIKNTTQYI